MKATFLKSAVLIATASLIPSLSFAFGDWGNLDGQSEGSWTCEVVDFNGQHYEASGADEREACSQAIYNCSNTAADGNCDIVGSSDGTRHHDRHRHHHRRNWD